MDRRKRTRYALHCPVSFRWLTERDELKQGLGFTQDLSSKSALVRCSESELPRTTESVEIRVSLAADVETLRPATLVGVGQVVRSAILPGEAAFVIVTKRPLKAVLDSKATLPQQPRAHARLKLKVVGESGGKQVRIEQAQVASKRKS